MELINIRLLVNDVPAAIGFWRDVMQIPLKYGDEALGYAYFETASAGIELMSQDGFAAALGEKTPAPTSTGRQTVIVFKVGNVDITYGELLARGATAVAGPQDRAQWGARSAQIGGPDGVLIEIYTSLA